MPLRSRSLITSDYYSLDPVPKALKVYLIILLFLWMLKSSLMLRLLSFLVVSNNYVLLFNVLNNIHSKQVRTLKAIQKLSNTHTQILRTARHYRKKSQKPSSYKTISDCGDILKRIKYLHIPKACTSRKPRQKYRQSRAYFYLQYYES